MAIIYNLLPALTHRFRIYCNRKAFLLLTDIFDLRALKILKTSKSNFEYISNDFL